MNDDDTAVGADLSAKRRLKATRIILLILIIGLREPTSHIPINLLIIIICTLHKEFYSLSLRACYGE